MKNSVFWSTYNLLEKNIFNTLTKKIAGNLVPLLFLQALSMISFYLCIGRVREILSASDAVGKEKFLFLSSYMQFNFWMFVLSIAVAVFSTGFLSFLIIRPMKKAIGFLRSFCDSLDGKDIRAGKVDLGKRIPVMTVDEIGEMFNTYNCLFEKMNNVFKQLQNTSDNIYGTIKTLTESSVQSTDNSYKLSEQSMSIAAAAEEMSQTIVCVAENSSRASGTSESAKTAAVEGKEVADEAVEYIKKVHKSTLDLSIMVKQLDNRAAEIGNIVMVITEIADQTNLLALNAAIEAARAGEEGRGFAVVADEVRKLAEKTIKATKEISGKIQAVQDESVQTARSMGVASEEVTKANEYIIRVGESLTSILNVVTEGRDEVTQIASAVEEQSAASSEIASNAEQSSAIAQHNKEMAGSIQSEITRLKDTSEFLINLTSRFDTGK